MGVFPRTADSGGQEHTVTIRRVRSVLASVVFATVVLGMTVATALADGGPVPYPK
jgi:hypothetical protein